MTLIDLNDPKNAASRGDVPEAVRYLVEVPYCVGVLEPPIIRCHPLGSFFENPFAGKGFATADDVAGNKVEHFRPATAAEIEKHCTVLPEVSQPAEAREACWRVWYEGAAGLSCVEVMARSESHAKSEVERLMMLSPGTAKTARQAVIEVSGNDSLIREYQSGWNAAIALAISVCNRRASPEDKNQSVKNEATKCGLQIEHEATSALGLTLRDELADTLRLYAVLSDDYQTLRANKDTELTALRTENAALARDLKNLRTFVEQPKMVGIGHPEACDDFRVVRDFIGSAKKNNAALAATVAGMREALEAFGKWRQAEVDAEDIRVMAEDEGSSNDPSVAGHISDAMKRATTAFQKCCDLIQQLNTALAAGKGESDE